MPIRKCLLRSEAGVRLHRLERLGAHEEIASRTFRLASRRNGRPRAFADERAALDAFDLEVIAALSDPVIIDMQRRGLLD